MASRWIRCEFASVTLAKDNKVTLCHVPPGNSANAHEIVIGEKALAAHLRNHADDHVGPCQQDTCASVTDCDDVNACTVDICHPDGTCDNSQPVDCDDSDVCTLDACEPATGCVNPPVPDQDQVGCDDGDLCSEDDVCVTGQCTGSPVPGCCTQSSDCPPSDACAVRFCDDTTGRCRQVDISTQCTAGACEVAFCDPATGCGTAPVACPDDRDICTVASCNPFICADSGACETLPNPDPPEPGQELTCDDGLDNDCDGEADCDDTEDCELDPACGGAVCTDTFEPNESCSDDIVADLGLLTDAPASVASVNATIGASDGDDWYRFTAVDVPESSGESFFISITGHPGSGFEGMWSMYRDICVPPPVIPPQTLGGNFTIPGFADNNDTSTYFIRIESSSSECTEYGVTVEVGRTCGNGQIDEGEVCDDGNALSCGTCSPDCQTVQTGGDCPPIAGCVTDADCLSGSCGTLDTGICD